MLQEPSPHIRPLAKPIVLNSLDAKAGVLMIHGFADSPYSLRDLASHVHRAGYGVTVLRLPGHGSRIEDFRASTLADWRQAVRREAADLRVRYPRVAMVGRSFGGVLALLELAEQPSAADALVTISTPHRIAAQRTLAAFLPVLQMLRPHGVIKKPWLKPEERIARMEGGRYEGFPIPALREFLRALSALTLERLRTIRTPTLILHGRQDTIAKPESAVHFLHELGGVMKELLWIDEASHAAESLHHHPLLQTRILSFLKQHLLDR